MALVIQPRLYMMVGLRDQSKPNSFLAGMDLAFRCFSTGPELIVSMVLSGLAWTGYILQLT